MNASTPAQRQAALLATASRDLAGGGLGLFVLPPELNLVVARGEGSHVWDIAGREYIDYHLGSGPVLLGHAHPAITRAVSEQLPKGTTYYFLNEPEIELAHRLVAAVPCADAVHYTGSGTEATFYALRMARAFTGREKVLKFEGAWHGMHDYGLWGTVPATASAYPRATPDSIGVPAATGDTVLVAPFNDAERAVALIEKHAHELAAVMVEPLQRVLLPVPGLLEALREVTMRHGIVLVFDSFFAALWQKLVWPHPKAWAGLAAIWLAILGLNFASRESAPPAAARLETAPSPELRRLLKQQELLLAELIERPARAVEPTKPAPPRPHSRRQEEFLAA